MFSKLKKDWFFSFLPVRLSTDKVANVRRNTVVGHFSGDDACENLKATSKVIFMIVCQRR